MSKSDKPYIVIIDLGTGSLRLSVLDLSGALVAAYRTENKTWYPQPGYVEQDPAAWWEDIGGMFMNIPDELRKNIRIISVTGQREGIVVVNDRFEPMNRLITWLDGRTQGQAEMIRQQFSDEEIYEETGLVHNPVWSLSKILWIRENEPGIYRSCYKFLQSVDYVQSRMTGIAATDVSMASRTCMFRPVDRRWSEKILERFGLSKAKLPSIYETGEMIGRITKSAAEYFGLESEVMIAAGAGDQQAAAVGVGAYREGIVSIGIGTASALSMTLSKPVPIPEGKIILNCAAVPGKWEYEPPIWNTGSLIKWFYENIDEKTHSYEQLIEATGKLEPGSDGLVALPYFAGAASPRWNPSLAGGFYGLTLAHKKEHLLQALMESVAFELKYNIDYFVGAGAQVDEVILSGGGTRNKVLCRIISDTINKPVRIFQETEASTWGLYCIIRSRIDPSVPVEKIYDSLNLSFSLLKPDNSKKEKYDLLYKRYLELGDHMSKLTFLKNI